MTTVRTIEILLIVGAVVGYIRAMYLFWRAHFHFKKSRDLSRKKRRSF